MKGLKLKFYPSVDRKSKKNGAIPIYVRISKGTTKTEVRLPVELNKDEHNHWDELGQFATNDNSGINSCIQKIRDEFTGLKYTHKDSYPSLSPLDVKRILFDKDENQKHDARLIDSMHYYFNNSVKSTGKFVVGTEKNYSKSINHFKCFLNYTNRSQIKIGEFTPLLAYEFYDYLQKDIAKIQKMGMTEVSASSIIKKIKVVFNRWVDAEIIGRNPFKNVRLKTKSDKKEPLSISEVKKLKEYDFNGERRLDEYRDLFLFQIYTGIAYSDINDLQRKHLNIINNNEVLLSKERFKTSEPLKQYLVEYAIKLIQKYSEHREIKVFNNRVFPRKANSNYNKALKEIAAIVGINKKLTTHIARHTCAQLIAECKIPFDVMDKMMGWSDKRQGTKAIYCSVTDDRLKDGKNIFDGYLKVML